MRWIHASPGTINDDNCQMSPSTPYPHIYANARRPLKETIDGGQACPVPIPAYLLPPIQTLLLTPTSSSAASPPSQYLPPVAVLHRVLLGVVIPPTDATVSLSGLSLYTQDETSLLQYACHVRRLTPTAALPSPSSSEDDDGDGAVLQEWMRHVEAWGGGVVTKATRVIVQGQTCTVVDPTPGAWERAAAAFVGPSEGEEKEEGDVLFGGLLEQLCLRLKLGTTTSSSNNNHTSADGCHAVVVEGAPGSGKTSLVGAAARKLGLPAVLLRPGALMAQHDVEADAAVMAAVAAAKALAPALLLVDNADLIFVGGGRRRGRAGRLLAGSRGEVDHAMAQWLRRALEAPAAVLGRGVALVLTVGEGWRLPAGGSDDGVPRLRIVGVGPKAARAVLRAELVGGDDDDDDDGGGIAEILEDAARRCQGFTLGEAATVARRARVLFSSSSVTWRAALDSTLADARARRLAAGTGLPALARVDPPVTWADVGGLRAAKAAVRDG